jgi:preprotein translocase subunit YajC
MKKFLSGGVVYFLLSTSVLFAQNTPEPPVRDSGMWQTFILVGTALLFFYFILYRPEQKRRKEMEQQRSTIKKGDKVNAMGIIGYVAKIQDSTIILRMYDGSKIEVLKGAITEVIPCTEEEAKKVNDEE